MMPLLKTNRAVPNRDSHETARRLGASWLAVPVRSIAMGVGAAAIAFWLVAAPKQALSAEEGALVTECTFNLAALKGAITDIDPDLDPGGSSSPGANLEISYIVVYSRVNDFDGQAFDPSGPAPLAYTGPVFCYNDDTSAEEVLQDAESVPIPNSAWHRNVESIDILDDQQALIMRHRLNDDDPAGADPADLHDGPRDGEIENRFCHSSGGNTRCVLVREPQ